jgi:DNA-binding IclR family transcriptional regulator
MSTIHVDLALDAPADISSVERLVLLARAATPDGMAAPTLRRITQGADNSESTARRVLQRLTAAGLIHRAVSDDQATKAWRMALNVSRDGTKGAQA